MVEGTKVLLTNTVKEWAKFTTERDRLKGIATEVAVITRKLVLEDLTFLKAQNIDVVCESVESMKVLGTTFQIDAVVDATFPNVKASISLKCGGATRAIIINANGTISAGGPPFPVDQFKKGIPDTFVNNAAEFVCDAFLNVARSGAAKE